MSDETIMKIKIATIANLILGVLSLAVVFIGIWVGNISSATATHDRQIARLEECTANQKELLQSINITVKAIQADMNTHMRKSH